MKIGEIEKKFVNSPRNVKKVVDCAERLVRFLNLSGRQNFLEVGCGNGAVSKYIARNYGLNVTGIDVDPKQIELAQKNTIEAIQNIHFLEVDTTHLPFQDNDFDIVLSFFVMHHIPNWLDALEEIKRVLKPGGYFIYADLVYPRLIATIGKSFQHNYGVTTIHDLNLFIEENKFSIIHASLSKSLIWNNYEAVYQKN